MIQWCAYCQRFLGEKVPYDSMSISHGICRSCLGKGLEHSLKSKAAYQALASIQKGLWEAGTGLDPDAAVKHCAEALAAQQRPIDVFMILAVPALHEVGKLWEKGRMSVAQEHRFTAFIEAIMGCLGGDVPESEAKGAPVLLINAEGNQHTLGVRLLALWLRSEGVLARAVYPGLPADEVAALVREVDPPIVGFSVSMEEQVPSVLAAIDRVLSLPKRRPVLLGGRAVRQGKIPPREGVIFALDLGERLEWIKGIAGQAAPQP